MCFKEIHIFIQNRCIKLIKSGSKNIYDVKKINLSNKLTFYSKIMGGGDLAPFSQKYEAASVFNIDNNQHIRMISEGSCDTED